MSNPNGVVTVSKRRINSYSLSETQRTDTTPSGLAWLVALFPRVAAKRDKPGLEDITASRYCFTEP
jgi:hypothetical protein